MKKKIKKNLKSVATISTQRKEKIITNMRCAVGKCKQSNSQKSSGKYVSFYSFPKDLAQKKLWVKFCKRTEFNAQTARICALHFKEDDFERNLKFEMGLSNRRALKLKPGAVPTIETCNAANIEANHNKTLICKEEAVPTIETIGTAKDVANDTQITLICKEENTSITFDTNENNLHLYMQSLEMKINELQQENDVLKETQNQSALTIKNLYSQVQRLRFTNENLEKALGRMFSEGQIKKLKNGDKRQNFTEADIAQSVTLYSTSPKAYRLLKRKHFPLPSIRTLQRWSQKLNVSTDILNPAVKIVSAANPIPEPQIRSTRVKVDIDYTPDLEEAHNSVTSSMLKGIHPNIKLKQKENDTSR